MTYSVYQHWDPLRVCIVGRSYSPEFYNYITNTKAREVMQRIARETEEDYQKLITLLESFGVEIIRPVLTDNHEDYMQDGKVLPPPMCPCDWSIMIGDKFYHNWKSDLLQKPYQHIFEKIKQNGNEIIQEPIRGIAPVLNRAQMTRVGKDLYMGTTSRAAGVPLFLSAVLANDSTLSNRIMSLFPEYRCHLIPTGGHSDGVYCPVTPGLIISLKDIPTYKDTFPGWEVIYLPDQSWDLVEPFLQLKGKNSGKWWVPGEELNDDFTDYVETWLGHWVGYVEETVFDVNMLVIDKHNVVCNNYNKEVFEAFERRGITPHVINFRHRYFWDGGLHCITSDIHRDGTMQDYFPERKK